MELKRASRKQIKLKVAMAGTSGSGKTMSALLVAYGITGDWSKIAVIDTENRSSELYVGSSAGDVTIGEFLTLQLNAPFTPERYIEAIALCEKTKEIECIIIDSITHEWDGKGGIISTNDSMGKNIVNWAKLTPRHNAFVDSIINCSKHTICTVRSKQEYLITENEGKKSVEKVGMRAITREGLEYEFTIFLDIDIRHMSSASKDRTGLFMDKPSVVITPAHGEAMKSWCETGIDEIESEKAERSEIELEISTSTTVEGLQFIWESFPVLQSKSWFKECVKLKKAELCAI